MSEVARSQRTGAVVAAVAFALTVGQLLLGTFSDLEQYEDKAFGYRLVLNTVLMLAAPLAWVLVQRRRARPAPVPWWPCVLIIGSFLFDVTGNTLDLYDAVSWFDNLSHFVTWFLLLWGIGLFIARVRITPRWALVAVVVGLGALLAIVWEIGEWYTFIRRGTELDGAYEDTLSDQLLGTLGALAAGLLVHRTTGRQPRSDDRS